MWKVRSRINIIEVQSHEAPKILDKIKSHDQPIYDVIINNKDIGQSDDTNHRR